ncbi:hypothetical protein [Nostoc sp. FACHB-145]|uniref:DUF488 family protein, N3 subclade n=1 Tax=Nostoc sp. FACHB-145 TaxID=2692836 RepID=UPI001F5596AC|nr:hypothetical protein [Nostoc sp. FACHB-145]
MIYTSYYAGQIKGEAVSISLSPPKGWQGKHSPVFAPTPQLLQWWKSSAKDAAAQQESKRQFSEILQSRTLLIQLWVNRQRQNPVDVTLCCYEKPSDFCHRHQVGEEVVQAYLPELWGGEVGLLGDDQPVSINKLAQMEKGIGLTDTESMTLTSSREHSNVTTNSLISPKQTIPIDFTYPAIVQSRSLQVLRRSYDCVFLPSNS